jgi:hypothetical protein
VCAKGKVGHRQETPCESRVPIRRSNRNERQLLQPVTSRVASLMQKGDARVSRVRAGSRIGAHHECIQKRPMTSSPLQPAGFPPSTLPAAASRMPSGCQKSREVDQDEGEALANVQLVRFW